MYNEDVSENIPENGNDIQDREPKESGTILVVPKDFEAPSGFPFSVLIHKGDTDDKEYLRSVVQKVIAADYEDKYVAINADTVDLLTPLLAALDITAVALVDIPDLTVPSGWRLSTGMYRTLSFNQLMADRKVESTHPKTAKVDGHDELAKNVKAAQDDLVHEKISALNANLDSLDKGQSDQDDEGE